MTDTNADATRAEIHNKLFGLGAAYHADADVRARAEAEPRAVLAENGLDALMPAPGVDVRIVADTGDVVHLPFPPDPNGEIADEDFGKLAGGYGSAQSAQSAASAGMCYSSAW